MRAAGEIWRFKSVTKVILPYKMCAAGEILRFKSVTNVILYLKNARRRQNFCGLRVLLM